jgi:hypothetical protein
VVRHRDHRGRGAAARPPRADTRRRRAGDARVHTVDTRAARRRAIRRRPIAPRVASPLPGARAGVPARSGPLRRSPVGGVR